jgi:cell volume regulation protein A
MVVRDKAVLDPATAGALQPGDYGYFLVDRDRLTRLDSLFRESPDVARRLGMLFGELPIRGDARIRDLVGLYGLDFGDANPEARLADWVEGRLGPDFALDAAVAVPGGRLVVRRLESGHAGSIGLQLDALTQVEPDERLLARLEEEDASFRGLRRWLARLSRPLPRA